MCGACAGAAAMTRRRKGDITRRDLKRKWPHHIALPAGKVRGLADSEVVRGFADTLSVAPLTYSLRRGDAHFMVFCLPSWKMRTRSVTDSAASPCRRGGDES
jgi:hypothetical protein